MKDKIIAALASAPGIGGVSIIRVSGDGSHNLIKNFFSNKKKIKSGRFYYGNFIYNNEIIDEVIVLFFNKKFSYTGEESLEINTHGSPLIVKKILDILYGTGMVVEPLPGEFTQRRFMNGKIDLVQAEAVTDLIHSESELSLKQSKEQLKGVLSEELLDIKNEITSLISTLELELDFSEEDLDFTPRSEIDEKFSKLLDILNNFISSYETGKIYNEGIKVVLSGKVNAGKSSLLNRLLKENRAIVTDIEGTTRDIIEERISIRGYLVRIIDTAGLRKTDDIVESEGIKRSLEHIENGDIVLNIIDGSKFDPNLVKSGNNIINVLNKADLNDSLECENSIKISCKDGRGISDLKDMIIDIVEKNMIKPRSAILTNKRHLDIVKRARQSIELARESLTFGMNNEVIIPDIKMGLDILGELTGETTSLDIINNIFANFCIGK
ncbi:MAG: tRNA uridine-5-carboxymethylaminomethyl(34) synthesis GTPase MnmE [Candidatus Cloacimonadota bacterium]|nr:MAG: tRNA uridine-5-carboxymethylaminomethyl(34) synthesis GTPase MnmE [Candidatus Cloacimonadota bacterium]PIE77698.1 MAG: tRNA uridine-5-carboxymethylaminomethyl(34) synthesis GTPase MnmE [Candidatus Delongbacteria bacterium]